MPTSYTSLIGLALPVTGELSGTWGDVVNNYITNYLDSAVAGTQTISGSQTAVTLSVTNGSSLVTAGSGATGSAQFQIINCTGNPAGLLTITAPASSRQYIIINATSTSQSVKIVGTGPTTGVTLIAGEKAHVAWNGSDFVKIATTAAAGGSNTQVQYNSSGVLAGSSNMTFDGTNLTVGGTASATKLIPTGGAITGNGMYLPAANSVAITTNGAQAIYIDSSQNVGIGTSSPAGRLEVKSSNTSRWWLENDTSATNTKMVFTNSSGVVNRARYQALEHYFQTGNVTDAAILDTSGNLGLGVTPSAWTNGRTALQIGGSTVAGLGFASAISETYTNAYVNSGVYKYFTTGPAGLFDFNNAASGGFSWRIAASGTAGNTISFTQAMTLDSSGNLGIGTTSIVFENGGGQVLYNATTPRLVFRNSTTGSTANDGTDLAAVSSDFYVFNREAGAVIIGTSGLDRARITSGGDLLVGTTSNGGGARLKSKVAAGTFGLEVTDESQSDFIVAPLSGAVCRVGPSAGSMAFYAANSERARITSGGDLLVSKTADNDTSVGLRYVASQYLSIVRDGNPPLYLNRLSSDGRIAEFARSSTIVGSIDVTTTATSYVTSSDYRIKHDIQPMTGALAKVAALKPVTYKWNVDDSAGEGFIAHELAEVCPQAVTGEKDAVDADGKPVYQGIDTSFLVATLTAAIQEQQALITALTARVAALESKGA